jgi:hypothetical protein
MEKVKGMKVKLTLGDNNTYVYPDFNQLDVIMALPQLVVNGRNITWNKYVDRYRGWLFDRTSDFFTDSGVDNPWGVCYGLLIVPTTFVTQAVTAFPDECTALTEPELADFYDNKVQIYAPEEIIDSNILQGIVAKDTLLIARTNHDGKALDPNDDTPGIVKNKYKTWDLYKVYKNINLG